MTTKTIEELARDADFANLAVHKELVEALRALVGEYGPNMASMRVDSPRRAMWRTAAALLARIEKE